MSKRALVVDDAKVVRTVSRRILEKFQFTVDEAEDGSVALAKCREGFPDVILLDWNMPVMDGFTFFTEFLKLPGHEVTKVIFCTTENDFSKIQQAITAGANEYVMKPFDEQIIESKLQQLGLL